eukprot:gnl/TRDRNA2_/TRDRNA2_194813_c0_seq1.p1 gnl/TRDRNA2_/TRDRNA2_194813_c0~~gnl/TRDRNA2_/TRDRNA2_194813_c0_seq1.p1  ORF type:complete len:386 (-),score=79.34 gnl/TRDRNA2_/TRDRNA2_194813_c0_seq1:53-1210(-)
MGCCHSSGTGSQGAAYIAKPQSSPEATGKSSNSCNGDVGANDAAFDAEDMSTFVEMQQIVAMTCQKAIQTAEWRLKGNWMTLDTALKSCTRVVSKEVSLAREAAKGRDVKMLATAVEAAEQASQLDVAGGFGAAKLWPPAKRVVETGELVRLRHAMLAAVLVSDVDALSVYLARAELLGESCGIEREFHNELLEQAGRGGEASLPPNEEEEHVPAGLVQPSPIGGYGGGRHGSGKSGSPSAGGSGPRRSSSRTSVGSGARGRASESPASAGANSPPRTATPSTGSPSRSESPSRSPPHGFGSKASGAGDTTPIRMDATSLEALGLPPDVKTVSQDELRAAYRRAALDFHPDRPHNAGSHEAAEKFRRAREAYERLRSSTSPPSYV